MYLNHSLSRYRQGQQGTEQQGDGQRSKHLASGQQGKPKQTGQCLPNRLGRGERPLRSVAEEKTGPKTQNKWLDTESHSDARIHTSSPTD